MWWRHFAQAVGLAAAASPSQKGSLDQRATEVLARVAHEARQPLSAARAAFELIRRLPEDAPAKERAWVVLDQQFVRLARMLDDLLEASRLRLATTVLRVEEIDLRRLVEEMAEAVRPQIAEKHQYLDTHLPEHAVWVEGDSVRLQQVVSNVLDNGIRYTEPGGRLFVDLRDKVKDAVLTVSDTGRGIPAGLLPHVFEPFVRDESGPKHGLGIGLSIARQLVELHGGTIYASSAGPGNGSQFVVVLPLESHRLRRQRVEASSTSLN
jgi:signal transduction histidine kinase